MLQYTIPSSTNLRVPSTSFFWIPKIYWLMISDRRRYLKAGQRGLSFQDTGNCDLDRKLDHQTEYAFITIAWSIRLIFVADVLPSRP